MNARCAELDARESRIEILYRTVHRPVPFPKNSTAFGTLVAPLAAPQASQAPQVPQAPHASEAMIAPP